MLIKAFQGKWRLGIVAVVIFLVLSNPSPGDFEQYLRNRLEDPLKKEGFLIGLIDGLISKYPIHRSNLLIFSLYDVGRETIFSKENGCQVVLGIGGIFIPLYQTAPGVTPFWQGRHMGYLRI
jgi:hypothetical protein